MREFKVTSLHNLDQLNSSEFQYLLGFYPKIVQIVRLPDNVPENQQTGTRWVVILEK